jgi:integrase
VFIRVGKLSDSRLRSLRPRSKSYQVADGGGLFAEVLPSGGVSFRYQYRIGGRKERVVIGAYPAMTLARARQVHREQQTMVEQGQSPACRVQEQKAIEKAGALDTVEAFARSWLQHWSAGKGHTKGWLEAGVFALIGRVPVREVTSAQILSVVDRIKSRGAAQSARRVRGILKQIFDYPIDRLVIQSDPVERVKARSIAGVSQRDRALSSDEIRAFLLALDNDSCREQSKIALKLLLLTLVRKRELLTARWENVDLGEGVWRIATTKTGKPYEVSLSRQTRELFERLKVLSCGSPFVLPNISRLEHPMGPCTLNEVIRRLMDRSMNGLTHFTVHDLRRTASTHLPEAGFDPTIVEKALGHTIKGVSGIYNRAEYREQRRNMLQQWADTVDTWTKHPGAKGVAMWHGNAFT